MVIIYVTFHSQALNNNIIKHLILRLEVHLKADQEHRKMFQRGNKSSSQSKCLSICFLLLGILPSAQPSSCSRICSLRCWYILESCPWHSILEFLIWQLPPRPQFPGQWKGQNTSPRFICLGIWTQRADATSMQLRFTPWPLCEGGPVWPHSLLCQLQRTHSHTL